MASGVRSWLLRRQTVDPYWEIFMERPVEDPRNLVPEIIRSAPESAVYPVMTELHSADVSARQVKEFATFLGAASVGIVDLAATDPAIGGQGYAFAIVCTFAADRDPRATRGVGGQVPVQNGQLVTFTLSAWIRELGYRATVSRDAKAVPLAVAAGLGTLDRGGRLVVPRLGTLVHVADVIRTDIPLTPDGQA
jgi:hypothetical protein